MGADRVPMRASVIALLLVLLTAPAAAAQPKAKVALGAKHRCANTDVVATPENLDLIREAVACLHNRTRALKRLRALAENEALAEAAAGHAGDMVARGYFDHETPEGDYFDKRILATGYLRGANGYKVGENLIWASGGLVHARRADARLARLVGAPREHPQGRVSRARAGRRVRHARRRRRRDDRGRVRRPRLTLAAAAGFARAMRRGYGDRFADLRLAGTRSGQGAGKAAQGACGP